MTGSRGLAKLIMLTALATNRGTASAADWTETFDASANAAYVTNPQLLPGSNIADQSGQVMLDGATHAQTERAQLTVTPRFSVIRYAHETDLDFETGSVDVAFLRKLERGQWTLDGQALVDSTVVSELGTTGITSINRRHYAESISTGYQYDLTERLSWQLQGMWQDTRYTDALRFGLTDYGYVSAQSGLGWSFSERIQGSFTLETDRIDPKVGVTQNEYSASVQLKRSFSERYAWRASIGGARVQAGPAGSQTSSLFELGASRQGERVQWDLSVKRAVLPIGNGLLAREDLASFGATVGISERSSVNLSLNVIRTEPVTVSVYLAPGISLAYQVYSGAAWGQASAQWLYHLSRHWALAATYQRARARNYLFAEWANGDQARIGVVWQSAPQ